ncbi:MAG: hypothetical protein D6732_06200, partial [Methanobacteriota archaeon]
MIIVLFLIQTMFSQNMKDFIISSDGNKNYIFITHPLKPGEGVILQKKVGKAWQNITGGAIRPLDDPYELRKIMGDQFIDIARVLKTPDPTQILRKLQMDPVYSLLLCLRYPRLGISMGRLIIDASTKPNAFEEYRVIFVDRGNQVKRTGEVLSVQTRRPAIREVPAIGLSQLDRFINITFRYPKFSWNNPDPVVGFHIYRSTDGKNFVRITPQMIYRLDEEELSHQDGLLEYGKQYWDKITGVTRFGMETPGKISAPFLLKDKKAPTVVQSVDAKFVDKGILVSWKPSPETDIAGYLLYRGTKQEKVDQLMTSKLLPPTEISYLDTTGIEGEHYFYGVIAVDKAGNKSKMSAKGDVVWPDKNPPPPPPSVRAVFDQKSHQVRLTWQRPKGEKLRGFYVYRGKAKNNMSQLTPKPVNGTFADSGYGEKHFDLGQAYVYGVRAVDMAWNLSDFAYTTVEIPDTVPPMPPTGLLLDIRQNGDVLLTWNPSPSPDVAQYEVSLKRDTDKKFVVLKRMGKDTLKGMIPRLQKGITYTFRVRAIDKAGNISPEGMMKTKKVRDFSPPPHPRNVFYKKTEKGYVITWNKVVDFDL